MNVIRTLRGRPATLPGPAPERQAPPPTARPTPKPQSETTSVDVENGYLVFLGRTVEALQALNAKLSLPIDRLKREFVTSAEFATFVAEPILASTWVDDARFSQPVESRLTRWVLERLDLTAGARRTVEAAVTWPALMTGLIEDFRAQEPHAAAPTPNWEPQQLLAALAVREHELNACLAHVGGENGAQLRLDGATWVVPGLIRIRGAMSLRGPAPPLEAVVDGRAFAAEMLDGVDPLRAESRFSGLVQVDFEPGWSGPAKLGLRLAGGWDCGGVTAQTPLAHAEGDGSPQSLVQALAPTLRRKATEASLSTAARAAETALEALRERALRVVLNAPRPTPTVSIVAPIAGGSHRIRHLLSFIDLWAADLHYEVVLAPTSPDLEAAVAAMVRSVDIRGGVRTLSPGARLTVGAAAHTGLMAASASDVLLMSDGYVPPRSPCLNAVLEETATSSSVVALRSAANFDGRRHSVQSAIAAIHRLTEARVDLRRLEDFRALPSNLAPGLVAASRQTLLELVARTPALVSSEAFWLSLLAFSNYIRAPKSLDFIEMTHIGAQRPDDMEALVLDFLILRRRAGAQLQGFEELTTEMSA